MDLFSVPKAGCSSSHTFRRNSYYVGNSVKGFQERHIKIFADELRALPLSERQAYLDHRRQTAEAIGKVSF